MGNIVPSNIDENGAHKGAMREMKWIIGGIAVGFLIVSFIGFAVLLQEGLGLKVENYIAVWIILTIATTIIGTLGILRLFGKGWYLKELRELKESATCPSCQKSYCIEYTKTQTISESVITETSSNSKGETTTKSYRVGVRRIFWRCKECGETGEGEVKYQERI